MKSGYSGRRANCALSPGEAIGASRHTPSAASYSKNHREEEEESQRFVERSAMGNSCSATHVSSKTFAVESTDNDGALAEVIAAEEDADAHEDTDPLPSTDGTDDSDFRDVPLEKEVDDAYEAEDRSSGENDVDGRSEEEEDEGSDEDEETGHSKFGAAPKIHQTVLRQEKYVVLYASGL
ncbi:hypothetical protein GN244_ATG16217 [Phytophthora infestans]|uniref:Uncharacterized protein n=1 Tax=Phytophthora infestans TaxID=4787 RepID=A0A833S3R4_PHYIN|nr:hypothetical protein GN244_ATG16217 [Phytophthora infestans]